MESQQQRRLKENSYNAIQEQQRRESLHNKSQLDCPGSPNHYNPKSNIDRGSFKRSFDTNTSQSKEKHLNHSALLSCLFTSEQKRSCSVSHRRLPLFPDQNSKRGRRSMVRKGWRRQERRRRRLSIYCIRQRPLPSSPTRRPLRKDLPTPHLIPFAAAGTAARRPASDCLP